MDGAGSVIGYPKVLEEHGRDERTAQSADANRKDRATTGLLTWTAAKGVSRAMEGGHQGTAEERPVWGRG